MIEASTANCLEVSEGRVMDCSNSFFSIKIGDEAEIDHVVTQEDVDKFIELTGDNNKIHLDKGYTAQTKLAKPIVHGMLTASFISTLIGTKLPGHGALWYEQHTRFLKPLYVGERIRVWGKVIKKQLALKLLVLEIVIYGDHNRKIVECKAKVVSVFPENIKEGV